MENKSIDKHEIKITLPLVALGLDFVPIFFFFLLFFIDAFGQSTFAGTILSSPAVLLLVLLSPAAGLIAGVIALNQGKKRIGRLGKTLAVIAVILPISAVIFIIVFFIGAATGMIALM